MGSSGAAGEVQDNVACVHFVLLSSKLPRGERQNNSYAEPVVISHDQQLHIRSALYVLTGISVVSPRGSSCKGLPCTVPAPWACQALV